MTGVLTLAVIGLGLSVDAFAAAVGKGAVGPRPRVRDALRIGAVFGLFEALTPLLGWAVGQALSGWITAIDHWIAFVLLAAVGGHMLWQAARGRPGEMGLEAAGAARPTGDGRTGAGRTPDGRGGLRLAATALATSIDAMAVGMSLALLDVNIWLACLIIGSITWVAATLGVLLGRQAGPHLGRHAEVLGGVALIGIGSLILYQHLSGAA